MASQAINALPCNSTSKDTEHAPLLGHRPRGKDRSVCVSRAFVIAAILFIVTVCFAADRYRRMSRMPQKGVDLLTEYDENTPAMPTQAPPAPHPATKRTLPAWPEKPGHLEKHAPVVRSKKYMRTHPPKMTTPQVPPTELVSGGLVAQVQDLQNHPCWHALGLKEALQLGASSEPLFALLPSHRSGEMITSKQCTAHVREKSDERLLLQLNCPSDIRVNFGVTKPKNSAKGYLRVSVELWTSTGTWPADLSTLRLLDMSIPSSIEVAATGAAQQPGMPLVVGGQLFIGGEHPMALTGAYSSGAESGVFVDIRHLQELSPPTETKPWQFGMVIGSIPEPSQARRAFMNYLHNERPGRRTPMVHYNSWFDYYGWQDEGFFHDRANRSDIMTEDSCIRRVREFGDHLVKDHGVQVDSFLFDDGWDNTQTLWEFDKTRLPNGFTKVDKVAREYGSRIGVWLSPWGGYGDSKTNRVREGKKRGFETLIDPWREEAFDLAGPKYKAWFMETITRMRHDQGANLFKFDGMSRSPREVESMLSMLADVRKVGVAGGTEDAQDNLWISLTTGTWPSPFFLFWSDNIWRGDGDVGPFPGQEPDDGLSQRQKWIRWRAEKVQQHIVQQSKFFPLSQLMIHGVVLAGHGDALFAGLGTATDIEFAQEVWSFVGLGLQLQELYITADRMTPQKWAIVAEGLAWSAKQSKVLLDTHWAFGDVSRRQVFCTASWDPEKGIGFVLLQNTQAWSQDSQQFSLSRVLELPERQEGKLAVSIVKSVPGNEDAKPQGLAGRMTGCHSVSSGGCEIDASTSTSVTLAHTEVLVLQVKLAKA